MNEGGEAAPSAPPSTEVTDIVKSTADNSPRVPHPKTQRRLGPDVVLESPRKYEDPAQQERQDVRAFSKSTPKGREARAEAAKDIKNIRQMRIGSTEYEAKQREAVDEIYASRRRIRELESRIAREKSQFERIVAQKKSGTPAAGKLMENLRALNSELSVSKTGLQESGGKLDRINMVYNFREATRKILDKLHWHEKAKLESARDRDELERYIDEKGHVEDLAEMDLYVVHGIVPGLGGWSSSQNSGKWEDKLATVIDLKPTVAASTIRFGEKSKLWYPFGVVYRSGRIDDASIYDAGSGSKGLGLKERVANGAWDIESYKQNLSRYPYKYDEKIVGGDPDVAGIFISLDEMPNDYHPYTGDPVGLTYREKTRGVDEGSRLLFFYEIFNEASRYGMKVFVFKNGIAHESSLDDHGGIILGDEVSPQEMINQAYEIPDENKEGIHQQAVSSIPPDVLAKAA